jgi:hypothetical protein
MRDEVRAMSAGLPNSIAALRLRTLGFRSIVMHAEYLDPAKAQAFERWAAGEGRRATGLQRLGEADSHVAYAFGPTPTPAGFEALDVPIMAPRGLQTLDTCGQPLAFMVHNGAQHFYRHPDPLRPDTVVVEWEADDTSVGRQHDTRTVLLPLALSPGGRQTVTVVPAALPPPGSYTVNLRLHDADGQVLARQRVVVAG